MLGFIPSKPNQYVFICSCGNHLYQAPRERNNEFGMPAICQLDHGIDQFRIAVQFSCSRLLEIATEAARIFTPSFSKMCSRCLLTLRGLMPRISAMSQLVFALAGQDSTSVSRGVSAALDNHLCAASVVGPSTPLAGLCCS